MMHNVRWALRCAPTSTGLAEGLSLGHRQTYLGMSEERLISRGS